MQEDSSSTTSARESNQASSSATKDEKEVRITTSKGTFVMGLFQTETPKTVTNFVNKTQSGFYNNLTFHRVESWVVQGGDPLGNGTGGGNMPTELTQRPFKEGSVGVARGNDITISNDSQFFICTADCSWLTGNYTNFGEVLDGMDVVKKIIVGDKILKIEILN
jgi:cyclophilin family peptidyl-prolyl cis-trans isomerase